MKVAKQLPVSWGTQGAQRDADGNTARVEAVPPSTATNALGNVKKQATNQTQALARGVHATGLRNGLVTQF